VANFVRSRLQAQPQILDKGDAGADRQRSSKAKCKCGTSPDDPPLLHIALYCFAIPIPIEKVMNEGKNDASQERDPQEGRILPVNSA
jgi:hypothetical protein